MYLKNHENNHQLRDTKLHHYLISLMKQAYMYTVYICTYVCSKMYIKKKHSRPLTVLVAEVVLPEPDGDGVHGAGDLGGEDGARRRRWRQDRHLLLTPEPLAVPHLE
jgi:hypothetical protein